MKPPAPDTVPFPDLDSINTIRRSLLRWYKRNARVLPWRNRDDVYAILVSEFMLQQTQAARVIERLPGWLEEFPDLNALASASRRRVLLAWTGMGYNRRAIALHETAAAIVQLHGGRIPDDPLILQTLPGIGRYTAHAITCFGHRKRVPMVDVNIRRAFSRLLERQIDESTMMAESAAWEAAEVLLPRRSYYNWNQALMDLGALVCTARQPDCDRCPIRTNCASAGRMIRAERSAPMAVRETPRRLYRGRVVELLRNAETYELHGSDLLDRLFNGDPDEEARLRDILATLHTDRMITLHPGNPETTLNTLLVRLVE